MYEQFYASPSILAIIFSSGININEKTYTKTFGEAKYLSYIYGIIKIKYNIKSKTKWQRKSE